MRAHHTRLGALAHAVHRHLFALLVTSFFVAALAPGPGLWMRSVSAGRVAVAGERLELGLPVLMLALLLFNAGFGVVPGQLRGLFRKPGVLLAGLTTNLVVPLLFLVCMAWALGQWWHNPHEAQCILV